MERYPHSLSLTDGEEKRWKKINSQFEKKHGRPDKIVDVFRLGMITRERQLGMIQEISNG